MKKYDNKTIEKLIFRYFNIRNFEISKFQSFYISSFKMLTPTRKMVPGKIGIIGGPIFRGPFFRGPIFRGPFFRDSPGQRT